MKIGIESNIKKVLKGLNDFEKKQIPYITMLTTNNIAFDFQGTLKKEIVEGMNLSIRGRTIPNAVRVRKATKSRPYAEIFVNDTSWTFYALQQHFKGGDRSRKGMEKAMIQLGYMYRHEILTPSPGVKIKPGTYNQMIAQLKLGYKAGYSVNETKRSRNRKTPSKTKLRFFIVTGKSKIDAAPGVYARMPGIDRPVCMLRISERPQYKKRFDMNKTLKNVISQRGNFHFQKAFKHAMTTAKK